MIEALACGTPVIARGGCSSVPEVIEPGRTGFIADTVDDLVEPVRRVHRIDRKTSRIEAEARFTV